METPTSSNQAPDPLSEPQRDDPKPYRYDARPTDDDVYPKWKTALRVGGIAAAIAGLLIVGYYLVRRPRNDVYVPDVRFPPVSQWTADPGLTIAPAFSRDGKLVAYASDRDGAAKLAIWLRPFPSGEAKQLISPAFNDSSPDLSPDNGRIVYRSERDGGGIYMASLSGSGPPRLLAAGGHRPRYSPDGKWIAYYDMSAAAGGEATAGRVFIVSPEGGQPRQVAPEFAYSRYPVWSPDSRFLLFEGRDPNRSRDWWVIPIEGGSAKATHALQTLSRVPAVHAPERWSGGKILYTATEQENPHLWEIAISALDWQILESPRQLTNGDAIEQVVDVDKDGRLLFTRMRVAHDVWSLPLDANRGTPSGQLLKITGGGVNQVPSVTADGAKLAYVSNRTGVRDIWVRDSHTGVENSITRFTRVGSRPALSPDGNRLAYPAIQEGHCVMLVTDLRSRTRDSILKGCFNIWGWSPDGSSLVVYTPGDNIRLVDTFKIGAQERHPLLRHSSYSFFDAAFSPQGGWIAFSAGSSAAKSQIYVAPFRGSAILEREWIPITREGGYSSAWSPDGGVLYFRSDQDGFQCIWSQTLDSAKRPAGSPVAVQHFHSPSFGTYMIPPNDFHFSVATDRLVLNLATVSANLWVTDKRE